MLKRTPRPPYVVRPGQPSIKVAFRFESAVGRIGDDPPSIESVIKEVLDWVGAKHHEPLPEKAYRFEDFEVDSLNSVIKATRAENAWALRFRQPDAPYGDRKAVAGRLWTTDLSVQKVGDQTVMGCRILCSSQPYENPPFDYVRPRVLVQISDKLGLYGAAQLEKGFHWLRTTEDLIKLKELFEARERLSPIVLISEFGSFFHKDHAPKLEEMADSAAARLHCLGHVYALPDHLAEAWTGLVGKEWSVFNGGVRIYEAGLQFDSQLPQEHPLWIGNKVLHMIQTMPDGVESFSRLLATRCMERAVDLAQSPFVLNFYSSLKLLNIEQGAFSSQEGNELEFIAQQQEQIRILTSQCEESMGLLSQSEEALRVEKEISTQLRQETHLYKQKVESLRLALAAGGISDILDGEKPKCYKDLIRWIPSALAGRLCLHSRAQRALKGARYHDFPLVVDALILLSQEYRDREMGVPGAGQKFETALNQLGLGFERSVSQTQVGQFGESYEVNYPLGSHTKRLLEWHLTKGNSRDPQHCLRIYFFFDSETNEVVVGWLPSHLETRSK